MAEVANGALQAAREDLLGSTVGQKRAQALSLRVEELEAVVMGLQQTVLEGCRERTALAESLAAFEAAEVDGEEAAGQKSQPTAAIKLCLLGTRD